MLAGLAPAGMAASFAARSKREELKLSLSRPLHPTERTSMGRVATSLMGQQATSNVLLDYLVRACEQRRRHGEAKRPGGPEVDNQFVLCRSLNRQDGWLLALEDTID